MLSRVKPIKFPAKKPVKQGLMKGSAGQNQYTCSLTGQNVVYIGVSSLPRQELTATITNYTDHPLFHVSCSILRMVYRKEFNVDIPNIGYQLGSLTPPLYFNGVADTLNQFRTITFYSRMQVLQDQNTPVVAGMNGKYIVSPSFTLDVSSPTLKFSDLCWNLARELQHWYCKVWTHDGDDVTQNQNWFRELYGYSAHIIEGMISNDPTSHKTFRYTPVRRLDNRNLYLSVKTDIKLSPTWNYQTSAGIPDDEYKRDAYYGKVMYFKDPYPIPDLELTSLFFPPDSVSWNTASQQDALRQIITDTNGDGIIRPNTNTYIAGLANVPSARVFSNVSKEGSFMCDSGDTRTSKLDFVFSGPINKFFKGYQYMDQPAANLPHHPSGPRMHGTCLLYAIQVHNPHSFDTSADPDINSADKIFVGLHVKRNTHCYLGKEKRVGFDTWKFENAVGGLIEMHAPKDVVPA